MPTKEIITLQLGHYANFVGTHWWNIQESSFDYGDPTNQKGEEIDHDVLYREGFTARGEVTFTPRLVMAELKGALGSLREDGLLYHGDADVDYSAWDGKTSVHKQSEATKNEFLKDLDEATPYENKSTSNRKPVTNYNLEKSVKVWSDYLRTHLHPKSTVIINEYSNESSNDPFDLWTKGITLSKVVEEIEERVRFYAEECDLLQGFHIICDSDNGFTGLSSSFMPYLKDEFPTKSLISFPVHAAKFVNDNIAKMNLRKQNSALLLPALTENCSLVLPLSLQPDNGKQDKVFPGLVYDANLSYHTSAVIASAIDTFTLSHRLKGASCSDLSEFRMKLAFGSRNVISTELMMPVPISQLHQNLSQLNELFSKPLEMTTITPNIGHVSPTNTDYLSNYMTLRGINSPNISLSSPFSNGKHDQYPVDLSDLILQHHATYYSGSCTNHKVLNSPMKTVAPFPKLIIAGWSGSQVQNNYTDATGNGLPGPNLNGHHRVNGTSNGVHRNGYGVSAPDPSVSLLTSLSCSSGTMAIFDGAAQALHMAKANMNRCGLEMDDIDPRIEYLLSMRDDYRPSIRSRFSSDEDMTE